MARPQNKYTAKLRAAVEAQIGTRTGPFVIADIEKVVGPLLSANKVTGINRKAHVNNAVAVLVAAGKVVRTGVVNTGKRGKPPVIYSVAA